MDVILLPEFKSCFFAVFALLISEISTVYAYGMLLIAS